MTLLYPHCWIFHGDLLIKIQGTTNGQVPPRGLPRLAAGRLGVDAVCVNAALRCLERSAGRWRKMLQLMKAMMEAWG